VDGTISLLGTLYGSIFVLLLGACIGSFLNVVIFRWPRDLSIRKPSRSFCPACRVPIAGYDNIPVLSFLLLRGRCRHCQAVISLQYPWVELATGLVFLMIYDGFFVARQRIGIGEFSTDWPMLIAHGVLGAGLVVLAVMDLEAYLVDIRVTGIVSLVGILGHAMWTPVSSIGQQGWIRPGPEQAGIIWAAAIGLGIGAWLFLRSVRGGATEVEAPVEEAEEGELFTGPPATLSRWRWVWLLLPIALVVVYLATMVKQGPQVPTVNAAPPTLLGRDALVASRPAMTPGTIRILWGTAILFVSLALVASQPHPEEDSNIVDAIESEAPSARRNALWELKFLTPAIVLSLAVPILFTFVPGIRAGFDRGLHVCVIGQWQPLLGLTTGLAGWIIGGAIGWIARIGFTLLFGKEALGMGDVHILAAAGAVAGWPVAFIGFFLAAPLALLAIVIIRLRRQSRALPYGPWLGLAFLIVVMLQDQILLYLNLRWMFG